MRPGPALEVAPEDPRSRRQLLMGGGAAALGAAALLSGCGKSTAPSNIALTKHSPGAKRDIHILNALLDLEYHAIAAYTASVPLLAAANRQEKRAHKKSHSPAKATAPKKKPPAPLSTAPLLASNAASAFLGHEIGHSVELKKIIKQAGGKPARPKPSYDLGNPNPSTKSDVLLVLRQIEQLQLVAYLQAVPLLTPGQLRSAAAAIFANEAQHLMVLRMELGLSAIPSPFVTGRE